MNLLTVWVSEAYFSIYYGVLAHVVNKPFQKAGI